MSDIRRKTVEGLKTGDTFSVSRTFCERDVIRFAEISRDYNPVHFDERFAKMKNFDRPICHGLLITSLLTEIGGQIGWLGSGMNLKFLKPVYFGDTVRCDFTITDINEKRRAEAKAVFINGNGLKVSEAVLTGILPGEPEKRIMEDMMGKTKET